MIITVADVLAAKTIEQGHTDNLKFELYGNRVWQSRMSIADGAECNNQIVVEKLINGNWKFYRAVNPEIGLKEVVVVV